MHLQLLGGLDCDYVFCKSDRLFRMESPFIWKIGCFPWGSSRSLDPLRPLIRSKRSGVQEQWSNRNGERNTSTVKDMTVPGRAPTGKTTMWAASDMARAEIATTKTYSFVPYRFRQRGETIRIWRTTYKIQRKKLLVRWDKMECKQIIHRSSLTASYFQRS